MTDKAQAQTLDTLRAQIFGNTKIRSKIIKFFGVDIEIRQSTLGDMIRDNEKSTNDSGSTLTRLAVIRTLINNTYLPGTDLHVFEETDIGVLETLPFGADFVRVSQAVEELTTVDFLGQKAD